MNKVMELHGAVEDVITNMRNLANSLQTVVEILSESKSTEEVKSKPMTPIPTKVTKPKKEKVYSLEDVRGVLAEKSQKGLIAEVKELIMRFGGNKLSDIEPSKYAELIKEALHTLFENDASSARPDGSMEVLRLYWWKHDCKNGQYSSAKVHRLLHVKPKNELPKNIQDYEITCGELPGLSVEVYD